MFYFLEKIKKWTASFVTDALSRACLSGYWSGQSDSLQSWTCWFCSGRIHWHSDIEMLSYKTLFP